MTRGTYLSVTLLFLVSLFLFPRPYLQPSDGSSPCDGASVNRARRPHAGERELRRCGAEPFAASPPIHRPPSLPIRRALRRIPSHLAARLARPGGAARTAGRARLTDGARRGSRAHKSTSRAANRTPGPANRAPVERIELRLMGGGGGARGPGAEPIVEAATEELKVRAGRTSAHVRRGEARPPVRREVAQIRRAELKGRRRRS
jgi:hypothetical protein